MEVENNILNDILNELKIIRKENSNMKKDYIKLYSKLYALGPEELDELGLHDELYK